jgi:hypothetical protein
MRNDDADVLYADAAAAACAVDDTEEDEAVELATLPSSALFTWSASDKGIVRRELKEGRISALILMKRYY